MTPEQQARLAVAETEIRALRDDIQKLEDALESANAKLDRIVATMDSGRGALWVLLAIGGGLGSIVMGATWLSSHVRL
jgi:chromosome segregation ATPase